LIKEYSTVLRHGDISLEFELPLNLLLNDSLYKVADPNSNSFFIPFLIILSHLNYIDITLLKYKVFLSKNSNQKPNNNPLSKQKNPYSISNSTFTK
jgi:hypothetical protein